MSYPHQYNRQQIRQHIRHLRRELTQEEQMQACEQVAERFCRHALFRRSKRIACYLANEGELDTSEIIQSIWEAKKCCFLPVLRPLPPNRLWFVPYTPQSTMDVNRYGISEPLFHANHHQSLLALDVILMPLVAFDLQGNRLGMGGGYYDRTLSRFRQQNRYHGPKLIGLAYDFQCVEKLMAQPWDVGLDGIVTPSQLLLFNR